MGAKVTKPKPLTREQRQLLAATPWDDLMAVFRGGGWTRRWLEEQRRLARREFPPEATIDQDLTRRREGLEAKARQRLYDEALARNEDYAEQLRAAKMLHDARPIKPIVASAKRGAATEMVPIAMASDWHVDETVHPAKVGGVNDYSREKAHHRASAWAANVVKMVELYRHIRAIRTIVVPLLGDFITGSIHEENAHDTWCPPIEAAQYAQGLLIGCLESILEGGKFDRLVIPCAVGNHARITRQSYHQSEVEQSLETVIYAGVKRHFTDDPRVDVIMPQAYLSHLGVLGVTVSYHHGHGVKYQGGIGGLAVPMMRYVHRQNSTRRADLYLSGHFHTSADFGAAVCNGSLIGYNAYAMRGGMAYERPQQSMVLIDSQYGRGPVIPIWVES